MNVKVYRNLHKKCFSVVSIETGRVIMHTSSICLKDVKFKVSKAGRERVLKSKQKNVHAFVYGHIIDDIGKEEGLVPVSYNPYLKDSFYIISTNETISEAKFVKMSNGKHIQATI